MLGITVRIENAGPGPRVRRLLFSDGSDPVITSAATLRLACVEDGADVEPDVVRELIAQVEPDAARDRALALLGYRERSVAELRRLLLADGYRAATVEATVGRLSDLQLVDDSRFAAMWVRSRRASGYGPSRIRRELREKGVSDDVIADANAAYDSCEDAVDDVAAARAVLGSARPTDRKHRERLIRKLVTRGFSFGVAVEAVGASHEHHDVDVADPSIVEDP